MAKSLFLIFLKQELLQKGWWKSSFPEMVSVQNHNRQPMSLLSANKNRSFDLKFSIVVEN